MELDVQRRPQKPTTLALFPEKVSAERYDPKVVKVVVLPVLHFFSSAGLPIYESRVATISTGRERGHKSYVTEWSRFLCDSWP